MLLEGDAPVEGPGHTTQHNLANNIKPGITAHISKTTKGYPLQSTRSMTSPNPLKSCLEGIDTSRPDVGSLSLPQVCSPCRHRARPVRAFLTKATAGSWILGHSTVVHRLSWGLFHICIHTYLHAYMQPPPPPHRIDLPRCDD